MAWKGIRKQGDMATNARKRYYRDAERYLKQASQNFGATAERYRTLARERLSDALNTYSKNTTQAFSKPIQRIANALGVDLSSARDAIKERSDSEERRIRERAISEEQSNKATRAGLTREELRQREARTLLNSDIGSRIIGGTVDLWGKDARIDTETGTKIDNKKILNVLYDRFEVDNLADLLTKMEEIAGESLYASPDDKAFYESAKITIQTYVRMHMQ